MNPAAIYSVSDLTHRIRATLEDEIGTVCVEGELSGFKIYPSGHAYFTLKDSGAQLSAVLFSSARARLASDLILKDGLKVRATGAVTVYPERGQYQLIVRTLTPAGQGDVMRQFEELKARLQKEGLFDESRKCKLPFLPRRIGIITSPTGAVIHDMLTILNRRFPNVEVRLAPVKVQGSEAAPEIVQAIRYFNSERGHATWSPDVIIVGRGGGSIDDLWAFNEESVVRAVADSTIPIISAVGHETDFTLCDFAADVRAPTPSAAAEIVLPPLSQVVQHLEELRTLLLRHLTQAAERRAQKTDTLNMRCSHALLNTSRTMRNRMDQARNHLTRLHERMTHEQRNALTRVQQRFQGILPYAIEKRRTHLQMISQQLNLLNPLAVLERGYSLTRLEDGTLVRSIEDVKQAAQIVTQTKDGFVTSTVTHRSQKKE